MQQFAAAGAGSEIIQCRFPSTLLHPKAGICLRRRLCVCLSAGCKNNRSLLKILPSKILLLVGPIHKYCLAIVKN